MALHAFWSGQIRISLVSFAVTLQPAAKRGSQMALHELSRTSGERVHHQNVAEDGSVIERDDIVKAYEYEKGSYVTVEKEEVDAIKLPSSDTLDLEAFADIHAIPILHFERPYFVIPANKKAEEIYNVFAEALDTGGKAGIGQITLRGREELCALLPYEQGLLLETLRYQKELDVPPDLFTRKSRPKGKAEFVDLARQLIHQNEHPLKLDRFHDQYQEALQELIEAKQKHRKPRLAKSKEKTEKVVDFADALRRSLRGKSAASEDARLVKRRRA